MDPHAAAVDQVLTVCQANPQERQVFIARERLNRLDDYAQMSAKEITELASKFERRTVADGRIVIPAKVIKNIQVLCFGQGNVREPANHFLLLISLPPPWLKPRKRCAYATRRNKRHRLSSQTSSAPTNGRSGASTSPPISHTPRVFSKLLWTMSFALSPHPLHLQI